MAISALSSICMPCRACMNVIFSGRLFFGSLRTHNLIIKTGTQRIEPNRDWGLPACLRSVRSGWPFRGRRPIWGELIYSDNIRVNFQVKSLTASLADDWRCSSQRPSVKSVPYDQYWTFSGFLLFARGPILMGIGKLMRKKTSAISDALGSK